MVISRSKDVCTDMGPRKIEKVKSLLEVESWNLFVEVAGEHVAADGIKCFARKIVGRCKGLPLAIVTVASAMANRHGVREWENAVREMELSATDLRGMIDEVLIPLKFSFDRLEDNILKNLFLYCACFPEDHNIYEDRILDYCIGEGLVDGLSNLRATKNKGEAMIESLNIACLLENGEKKGSVRIHDMMRELALWITSLASNSNPKFLIRTGRSVKEAPQAHEWVNAARISLINTQIKKLQELGDACRKLTTLLLRNNWDLTLIPPTNFLQHVDHLRALDITFTLKLESLPESLSCLVNLRVLRLVRCARLRASPALLMLPQLQVLDLNFCSEILGRSECVGGASNLRYLNMEWTKVSIPVGVISCLHKLEELRLCGAENIKWRVSGAKDEKWDARRSDDSRIDVGELSRLTYLTSLTIGFKDIIISDWFKPLANKITALTLERCRVVRQEALQALNESQNLQDLLIKDCQGLKCVRIGAECTELINCEDLEVLLDGADGQVDHQDLHYCLMLSLTGLPKLVRICVGLTPLNFFCQLSSITMVRCNSLRMVFTKGMPRLFNNLEMIEVRNCERMEVIIEEAEEEDVVISPFPRLMTLQLEDLPALHDMCSSNHILHCPLIGEVYVRNCPSLKKDPLHIRSKDGLLVIDVSEWRKGDKVVEDEIQASQC